MINIKQMTYGLTAAAAIGSIMIALATFGINDNGYRTVVQRPNGDTFVKFEPGVYFDWFGTSTAYPDVFTYDFTGPVDPITGKCVVAENQCAEVRYQDGGTGAIHGVARMILPSSEEDMLEVHRAFRTESGVRDKLLRPVINEGMNLTAGLMTSEEAYAEKRNEFLEWSNDQVSKGKYLTSLEEKTQIVEPEEVDASGRVVKRAITRIQNVPVIRRNIATNEPMRGDAPLKEYNVTVSGFQIQDWSFEPKTLDQINEKREANMAIITSQANAARANQERLQTIAEGERNVAKARYDEEVNKAKAVVIAERQKEVAEIAASQQVEVNRQNYLAQVEDVKAAEQYALALKARSTAEADAKRRVLEADGALAQKLETYERVMARAFTEFGKQKWTPEVIMGGNESVGGNAANDMIQLLTTQAAKDLALDMKIGTPTR